MILDASRRAAVMLEYTKRQGLCCRDVGLQSLYKIFRMHHKKKPSIKTRIVGV